MDNHGQVPGAWKGQPGVQPDPIPADTNERTPPHRLEPVGGMATT